MTCKDVNEFLADYLAGTLPWGQRLAFNFHLLLCRGCRRYLASYATTVRVAQSLAAPLEPAEEQVPDELLRAILAARGGERRTRTDGQLPPLGA